jgi:hypothetical protein
MYGINMKTDRAVYFDYRFIELKVSFLTAVVKIMALLFRLLHSLVIHHSTEGGQINTSFATGVNLKQFLIAMEGTF